jgi:hypothetical protein
VQAIQQDLFHNDVQYKRATALGRALLHNMNDERTRMELGRSVDSQQADWLQLMATVQGEREHLESLLREWRRTEAMVDEIDTRLRDLKRALTSNVSDNYESLQLELLRCKVRAMSCSQQADYDVIQ